MQVWSNGVQASCGHNSTRLGADCYFSYSTAITPVVTALSHSTITTGDLLVITGRGFDANVDNNAVTLGGVSSCVLIAATATQLSCIVTDTPAGTFPVQVTVLTGGAGIATIAAGVPLLTYALRVTTASAAAGSVCGGNAVTFIGTGFNPMPALNQVRS